MNVCVILSNHFRSLPYTWPYIKQFYGANVDYYISTYDHQENYLTIEEKKQLLGKNHKHTPETYRERMLTLSEKDSSIEDFILNEIKPVNYEIVPQHTLLLDLNSNFNFLTNLSTEQKSWLIGPHWSRVRAFNLLSPQDKSYDIIFYNRCDVIPTAKLTIDQLLNNYVELPEDSKNGVVMGTWLRVLKGFVSVCDQMFYSNSETMSTIMSNYPENVLELVKENNLFSSLNDKTVKSHKFFGTYLQSLGLTIRDKKLFEPVKVTKEHVLSKLPLDSKEVEIMLRNKDLEINFNYKY